MGLRPVPRRSNGRCDSLATKLHMKLSKYDRQTQPGLSPLWILQVGTLCKKVSSNLAKNPPFGGSISSLSRNCWCSGMSLLSDTPVLGRHLRSQGIGSFGGHIVSSLSLGNDLSDRRVPLLRDSGECCPLNMPSHRCSQSGLA